MWLLFVLWEYKKSPHFVNLKQKMSNAHVRQKCKQTDAMLRVGAQEGI